MRFILLILSLFFTCLANASLLSIHVVSPTSFPETMKTGDADQVVKVTVTNNANYSIYLIANLNGTDSNWSRAISSCSNVTQLTPGATCNLQGIYSPQTTAWQSKIILHTNILPSATPASGFESNDTLITTSVTQGGAASLATSWSTALPTTTLLGQSYPVVLTVTNSGGVSAVLAEPTWSATPASEFGTTSGTCISNSYILAAGSSCTLQKTFTPVVIGEKSLNVTVPYDADKTVAPAAATTSTTSSSAAGAVLTALWTTPLPTTSLVAEESTVVLTITNGGNQTATLNNIAWASLPSADFSADSSGTCESTSTLAAGASCTYKRTFLPTTAGEKSLNATVAYESGKTVTPQAATTSTTGGAGAAVLSYTWTSSLSDKTYAYPTNTGITKQYRAVLKITNNSAYTATIGDIALANTTTSDRFLLGQDSCSSRRLSSGEFCTVTVNWLPALSDGVANPTGTEQTVTVDIPHDGATDQESQTTHTIRAYLQLYSGAGTTTPVSNIELTDVGTFTYTVKNMSDTNITSNTITLSGTLYLASSTLSGCSSINAAATCSLIFTTDASSYGGDSTEGITQLASYQSATGSATFTAGLTVAPANPVINGGDDISITSNAPGSFTITNDSNFNWYPPDSGYDYAITIAMSANVTPWIALTQSCFVDSESYIGPGNSCTVDYTVEATHGINQATVTAVGRNATERSVHMLNNNAIQVGVTETGHLKYKAITLSNLSDEVTFSNLTLASLTLPESLSEKIELCPSTGTTNCSATYNSTCPTNGSTFELVKSGGSCKLWYHARSTASLTATPATVNIQVIRDGTAQAAVPFTFTYGNDVYAGGDFDDKASVNSKLQAGSGIKNIARWDGTTWQAMKTGLNGAVHALLATESDLYVGGEFTPDGGGTNASSAINHIARWDGTQFNGINMGLNNTVYALAGDDTSLYAGGMFTAPDSSPTTILQRVALFNGGNWLALGAGLNNDPDPLAAVRTLVLKNGILYAGGNFTQTPTTPMAGAVNYIGTFDVSSLSNSWEQFVLSSSLNQYVFSIAFLSNVLYAGGSFTQFDSGNAYYIINSNNGTSWTTLTPSGGSGPGLSAAVNSVAEGPGSMIYMGGGFIQSQDNTVSDLNFITRWNGTTFQRLPDNGANSGLDDAVYTLQGDGGDYLYVGGEFTADHNVTTPLTLNGIARWNNVKEQWEALGQGFSKISGTPTVYALAVQVPRISITANTITYPSKTRIESNENKEHT